MGAAQPGLCAETAAVCVAFVTSGTRAEPASSRVDIAPGGIHVDFMVKAAITALLLSSCAIAVSAQVLVTTEVPIGRTRADSIAVDSQGAVWAADFVFATIHQIDANGTIKNFTPGTASEAVVIGPDGNVWFNTEDFPGGTTVIGSIGRMTADGSVALFRNTLEHEIIGARLAVGPDGIAASRDGSVWVVGSNWSGDHIVEPRIATSSATGEWRSWLLPATVAPLGVAATDSAVFFGDFATKGVWRFDVESAAATRIFGDRGWPVALVTNRDAVYVVTNGVKGNFIYRLLADGSAVASAPLPSYSGNALNATIAFSPSSRNVFYVSLSDGTDRAARLIRIEELNGRRRAVRR